MKYQAYEDSSKYSILKFDNYNDTLDIVDKFIWEYKITSPILKDAIKEGQENK